MGKGGKGKDKAKNTLPFLTLVQNAFCRRAEETFDG